MPLTAGVYVFFKNSNPILSDTKVRQALVDAANRTAVIRKLSYPAIAVDEPLLHNQLGYNPTYAQITNQPNLAVSILNTDGWQLGANGVRFKDGQPLAFTLTVPNDPEYLMVANTLSSQWRAIGL